MRDHDWCATPLGPVRGWSERLKVLVEQVLASPLVASLVCGPERILIYNDAASRLYGDRHPAALGQPLPVVFPEGWVAVAPLYERAFAGEVVQVTGQAVDTRGEGRPTDTFDALLMPVRDEAGAVAFVHMTGFEAGERQRTHAALLDSETRFRALATAGALMTYRMSADWRLMRQLSGQDILSDTAEPSEEWADAYLLPEDRAAIFAVIDEAIRTKSLFELEHRVRLADGGIGWVRSRAVPLLGPDGEIVEWFGVGRDVTERKEAQEQVRRSQEDHQRELERQVSERTGELTASRDLLQATLDSSMDMIQVFEAVRDSAGEIVDFRWILNNHRSESQYGEVRGHSLLQRNPGVVAEGIFAALRHTAETGEPSITERHYAHEQFDGWFHQSIVKLGDGVATTSKDITDWKATQAEVLRLQGQVAQARIAESEGRLAAIFAHAPVGLSEVDAGGRFLRVNDELCRILGRSREDLLGLSIAEVTLSEDVALSVGTLKCVLATGAGASLDKRYVRPDATVVWASSSFACPAGAHGPAASVLVVTVDLTARRQAEAALRESEARLREFGEASQDVLWIRDVETLNWTYLTPAFETIYGASREAALTGDTFRNWKEMIVPEDRDEAVASIRRVVEGRRVMFEYRVRRAEDGAIRWLRDTDFPILDAAGRVGSIGGIGRDITEEKETAERMKVLVAELQHRTRNLLGVVRSTAEKTVRASTDLDDFRERFGHRLAALGRVQGLLSRLNEWDRVTFDELLRSQLSAMDGEIGRVGLDGPEGVALRSSTVQTFALAIHELITNALKYGALAHPTGRLAIAWWLAARGADGRPWLHVDWRESGVPMPARDAPPRGGGSGRELIERALPYQLGAETTFLMKEDGIHCTIALPVSERQGARRSADAR